MRDTPNPAVVQAILDRAIEWKMEQDEKAAAGFPLRGLCDTPSATQPAGPEKKLGKKKSQAAGSARPAGSHNETPKAVNE